MDWAGIIFIVGVAAVAYLLAIVIWAAFQIAKSIGDVPHLPDGLAAPPESQAGSGHERGSAACEDRTRHSESQ